MALWFLQPLLWWSTWFPKHENKTLRIISKRWPPSSSSSSVPGGHTVTFNYPLMADYRHFVPSLTVFHTILQFAHYEPWCLTLCTASIQLILWIIKETGINSFSLRLCTEKEEEVLEKAGAPRSRSVKFTHRRKAEIPSHSHLGFPIRYMQKDVSQSSASTQKGAPGPCLKAST